MKHHVSRWIGSWFLGVVTVNLFFAGLNVGMGLSGNNQKLKVFGGMLTVPSLLGVIVILLQFGIWEKRLRLCELQNQAVHRQNSSGSLPSEE